MALKRLIDVGVAFPIKPARLGAAPPASDVLDNVGAAEGSEGGVGGPEGGTGARNGSTEAKRAVSAAAPGVTPAGEPERTGEGHTARARAAVEYVPGKIRGGKRSGRWGRAPEEARQGDWIGASLPKGYRKRLNRLALRHDLMLWQVLTEAVDLFAERYGEDTPEDIRDIRAGR